MAGSFIDDLVQAGGYIFGPGTNAPSYEALQRRRQIAAALASRRSKFPTNVGEGLTYFGEQLGDIIAERRTDAAERAYNERAAAGNPPVDLSTGVPTTAPPPGGSAALDPAATGADPISQQVARADAL